MLLAASKDMDINLPESWMVGDSPSDIEAGARAGCRTIMLAGRTHEQKIKPGEPGPDYRAVNLKEVVNIIKMRARSGRESANALPPEQPIQQLREEPQQPPVQQQITPPQQQVEPEQAVPRQSAEKPTTEQLLSNILEQIKKMQRNSMFGEFSITRFIAGIAQGLVFLCLLVSVWFLTAPAKQSNPLLISIGFAILLQLMALTFYMMRGPR
jgi:hypothetical protein